MLARPERFFEDRFGSDLVGDGAAARLERCAGRVDHADLYLEYRVSEELVLEEGAVKKAARHVSQGAGIRAQSGERTGYAHTDDLALPNLEEAARQARAIADQAGTSAVVAVGPRAGRTISTRSPSRPSPPISTARSSLLGPDGRGGARARPARAPGHRHPRQRGRGRPDRDAVGLDGRRRPPAHAAQRHGHRRGGRASGRSAATAAAGACALRLLPRGRSLEALRVRGGAPGGGEARRGGRARGRR